MTPKQSKSSLLGYLLYIPFVLGFYGILCFYDPLQRIAIRISRRHHDIVIKYVNASLCVLLKVLGAKISTQFEEELDPQKIYIIVANHQSIYDPPLMHYVFSSLKPRFVAKEELSKWVPSVSYNLRYGLNAIIDRTNPRQALPEIEKLGLNMIKHNFSAVIFPEGTRAKNGIPKEFNPAGVYKLIKTVPEARLLPVTIIDSYQIYSKKFYFSPSLHIKIKADKSIDPLKIGQKEAIIEVEKIVKSNLPKVSL